jgi:hypothetical protein
MRSSYRLAQHQRTLSPSPCGGYVTLGFNFEVKEINHIVVMSEVPLDHYRFPSLCFRNHSAELGLLPSQICPDMSLSKIEK